MKQTAYEMAETNLLEDTGDIPFGELSAKEQKLFKALSKIEGEGLVQIAIRERLSSGSVRGFRKMIIELKDQYQDCGRERMIEVIGVDAVKLIEAI